ncbi:amino acid ABC transporter permease [Pantoea dispersa]|uniref:amino acid ABC transporter permease n=1 Tax=Pantoea dispersa TaxID=59814 RepID=UPI0024AF00D6|nr:amino acid ABC transporter permease [Pantoea dispersa]MDI6636450.1 amino acid ABC transporter permease [Pantoea dispersa]
MNYINWAEITGLFSYYNLLLLVQGLGITLALSAFGCMIGFLSGFALAVVINTKARIIAPIRSIIHVYFFIFRRIPFLVTLFLVFFISQYSGLRFSTFIVALISVCLIAAAYLGEIIRSGLESVHPNQWESAATMNFSYLQTLRHVIVPQSMTVVIAPTFSFFVMYIKDTTLASQIGVMELTSASKILSDKGYSATLVYAVVLLLYFFVSFPLSRLGKRLERKIVTARHH